MSTRTMPDSDPALLAWLLNLSTKIALAPATYGVSTVLSDSLEEAVELFQTTLAACDAGDRSKARVSAKNAAREAAKLQARYVTNAVNALDTVTDAQKNSLGINVRKAPEPIPAPVTMPNIEVGKVMQNIVDLVVHGSGTIRRGIPANVQAAEVISYIGAEPPADPQLWIKQGTTTRSRFAVEFPLDAEPFSKVWLSARWLSPTMAPGPLCPPVATNLGTWLAVSEPANAGHPTANAEADETPTLKKAA